MKKIIRLTETDLTRLVRRVIKEQEGDDPTKFVLIQNEDEESVQNKLMELPKTMHYLAILNCEGADFSDVDICSFPKLKFVNLKGTPNNFEESVDCDYEKQGMWGYDFFKRYMSSKQFQNF